MKVKVIQTDKNNRERCYECGSSSAFLQGITDWQDLEGQELGSLQNAIDKANQVRNAKYFYFLVYQVENLVPIFHSAQEYIDYWEDRAKKQEAQDQKAREDRAAKKIERKKKQLEKLKKELEQESNSK